MNGGCVSCGKPLDECVGLRFLLSQPPQTEPAIAFRSLIDKLCFVNVPDNGLFACNNCARKIITVEKGLSQLYNQFSAQFQLAQPDIVNLDNLGDRLRNELQELGRDPLLKNSSVDHVVDFTLDQLWEKTEQLAPTWTEVLNTADNLSVPKAAFTMSIILNSQDPKYSNVQTVLGSILYHSGCDKQLITDLHSLGVTKCYGQILKDVAKYQLYHEKKIDEFRNDSDFVMFVIDNIDYVIKTTLDRAGKISRTSRHDIARYAIKPRIIDDTKNRTPREADIEVNTYYHTDEDIFKLKNALVSLVVDISKKHLPALEKALKNVDVKPQIPFEEERRQKTKKFL
jgi:hypothetical protein